MNCFPVEKAKRALLTLLMLFLLTNSFITPIYAALPFDYRKIRIFQKVEDVDNPNYVSSPRPIIAYEDMPFRFTLLYEDFPWVNIWDEMRVGGFVFGHPMQAADPYKVDYVYFETEGIGVDVYPRKGFVRNRGLTDLGINIQGISPSPGLKYVRVWLYIVLYDKNLDCSPAEEAKLPWEDKTVCLVKLTIPVEVKKPEPIAGFALDLDNLMRIVLMGSMSIQLFLLLFAPHITGFVSPYTSRVVRKLFILAILAALFINRHALADGLRRAFESAGAPTAPPIMAAAAAWDMFGKSVKNNVGGMVWMGFLELLTYMVDGAGRDLITTPEMGREERTFGRYLANTSLPPLAYCFWIAPGLIMLLLVVTYSFLNFLYGQAILAILIGLGIIMMMWSPTVRLGSHVFTWSLILEATMDIPAGMIANLAWNTPSYLDIGGTRFLFDLGPSLMLHMFAAITVAYFAAISFVGYALAESLSAVLVRE